MKIKRIPRYLYGQYLGKKWDISRDLRFELADVFMGDYREKKISRSQIRLAHKEGFSVESWVLYELTSEKSSRYLSDAAYFAMYPLNGSFTKWIDDKLTLKYLCYGTPMNRYMPDYYYQLDKHGRILCLLDCPEKKETATMADVACLLREKGTLAIKLMNGSYGRGFYKAEYSDCTYILNGEQMDENAFCDAMSKLRNYLITEYFHPHPELKHISVKTPGCIRYAVGRMDGVCHMLTGGLAIGTKASGYVENYAKGGIWCYLDENGSFTSGDILDQAHYKNVCILTHPDTGEALSGKIPHWEEIEQAARMFCSQFPQLSYLGFDFVVTSDDRVKILEINSLSALDCFQNHLRGALESPAAAFFRRRLEKRD